MNDIERFLKKITIDENNHWIWHGAKTGTHGQYGGFQYNGRLQQSHRAIWQIKIGSIPEGLTIKHKCKITLCQNPDHMELVTRGENSNLGDGPTGLNSRKTGCPYDHGPYDYISPKGFRACRTCSKIKVWGQRQGMSMQQALLEYNPSSYSHGKICKVKGCFLKHKSKGYCGKHYARLKQTGNLELVEFKPRLCEEKGCFNSHKARGLCIKHYTRVIRREKKEKLV